MTTLDQVRLVVEELGERATAVAVSRRLEQRFGVRVEARFVPIYRATVRAEEERQRAWALAARIAKEDQRTRSIIQTRKKSS
jgi:hypothetical protein